MCQGSFEGVYRKFQGCFKEVLRVFQGRFGKISRVFQKILMGVSSKIRDGLKKKRLMEWLGGSSMTRFSIEKKKRIWP